jgi:hypothetical protein
VCAAARPAADAGMGADGVGRRRRAPGIGAGHQRRRRVPVPGAGPSGATVAAVRQGAGADRGLGRPLTVSHARERLDYRTSNGGEPFFFKTHYPHNRIVGGGFFSGFVSMRVSEAWELLAGAMAQPAWRSCGPRSAGTARPPSWVVKTRRSPLHPRPLLLPRRCHRSAAAGLRLQHRAASSPRRILPRWPHVSNGHGTTGPRVHLVNPPVLRRPVPRLTRIMVDQTDRQISPDCKPASFRAASPGGEIPEADLDVDVTLTIPSG